jgi:hypothetical protein
VFNECNDASEKLLDIDGISNEDTPHNEDPDIEQPPSISEAIEMVRRLKLLSTAQHAELHPFLTQLQSKLIDVYLDSNISKQRSILDFLKTCCVRN